MSNIKVDCECGNTYNKSYENRHFLSKIHQLYLEKLSDKTDTFNKSDDDEVVDDDDIVDDDFLDSLNNINYVIDEEPIKEIREPTFKLKKTKPKVINYDIDETEDDIFSNKPTAILGEQKHILLSKIKQYKLLFPDELKKFRIKKNPSVEDLQVAIDEMDVIISTGSIDTFITESILQSLKVIEGVSTLTPFNVSGLADILKNNITFHQLSKQLYLKYHVFSNIPPESQLLFIIATTAYICVQKNKSKTILRTYLDEPANVI